jgi:peroxiredoxin
MPAKSFAEILDEATDRARDLDAPLNVRLQTVADEVRRLSPAFADIVDRMVSRLADNGVGLAAPKPGEIMPDFVLPDEAGRLVCLSDLLDKGPAIISFNRGHWCPYCKLNVDALAKAAPDIENLGVQIVAISPETQAYGAALRDYAKAPFHVLTDIDGGYALELNLLFWVGDEKRNAMCAGGYDVAPYQGNETWMLPIPATFVVGQDGIVKARFIDPDYRHRVDIEDLLAALRAGAPQATTVK